MSEELYLICCTLLPSNAGADLSKLCEKIMNILQDYSTATKVIYRFKVTGEPQILAVVNVFNIIGLERSISGLWRIGSVDVSCQPLVTYETFGNFLGVSSDLTLPSQHTVDSSNLYWMQFDVNHDGKSTRELMEIWRQEATAALSARVKDGLKLDLFKVVCERKVHVFIQCPSSDLDKLSFSLPIMELNGANVKIRCRNLQMLDEYVTNINTINL